MVVAQELHPGGVIGAQPRGARVAGADGRRGRLTREAARFHGVHDPAAGERVDHVRRIARQEDAVGVRGFDRRVHDHAAHRVRRLGAPGVAPGDPRIEVLPGVAAVGLERDQAEPDVRDPGPFGKEPRVSARRDLLPELQVDRVRVEVDALDDVLGARLHVARRHAGIEPGPAADHRFHTVRPDYDARPPRLLASGAAQLHAPAIVGVAAHPGRFGADQQGDARRRGPCREERVEAGAIEDPADVALGDLDRRVVWSEENHPRDLARHPRRAVRLGELA